MITNISFCASFQIVLLDSMGENVLHPADIQTMVNDVSKSATALKNLRSHRRMYEVSISIVLFYNNTYTSTAYKLIYLREELLKF